MRDLIAAAIAFLLLATAASLGTTLQTYRKRRRKTREGERTLGRSIVAEIPTQDDLLLFTEDGQQFHYGAVSMDKDAIRTVRLLINGAVIADYACVRAGGAERPRSTGSPIDDRPDGIARDRWDVTVETDADTVIVECGAIRERVSQELARAVFDAVRSAMERLDARARERR